MNVYVKNLSVTVRMGWITIMEARGRTIKIMLSEDDRELVDINFYGDNQDVWVGFKVEDHFERYCVNLREDSEELCIIGIMLNDVYEYEKYKGIVLVD